MLICTNFPQAGCLKMVGRRLLRVMGGRSDSVIGTSGVTSSADVPRRGSPLRLRAINGSQNLAKYESECRAGQLHQMPAPHQCPSRPSGGWRRRFGSHHLAGALATGQALWAAPFLTHDE